VVLATTAVLIGAGAVLIGALEHDRSMASLTPSQQIVAAFFASVNRTSGFATVDAASMASTTLLVMCVLMFIGGSPGSVAGGIKTTTVAVLYASLRATVRGGDAVLGRRTVSDEVVRRAVVVTSASVAIVFLSLFALVLVEDHDVLALLVEVCSAYGTVGFSTGITADLSVAGKLVVMLTMFVGRVGPFTIALAAARSVARCRYRYASESLPIG
jgi:trk system potassium uptake protein TrkH